MLEGVCCNPEIWVFWICLAAWYLHICKPKAILASVVPHPTCSFVFKGHLMRSIGKWVYGDSAHERPLTSLHLKKSSLTVDSCSAYILAKSPPVIEKSHTKAILHIQFWNPVLTWIWFFSPILFMRKMIFLLSTKTYQNVEKRSDGCHLVDYIFDKYFDL